MGKGFNGDLWDDSALINAFDNAMTTFKEMHAKSDKCGSNDEGIIDEKTTRQVRQIIPEDKVENISNDTTEDTAEAASLDLTTEENQSASEFHALEPEHPQSSGFPCTDGSGYGYSDQQNVDCEQLLKQYYQLEEQKQRVLEQLHQANYWNYQTPVGNYACQSTQNSVYNNVSAQGINSSCSLCSCQCTMIPSASCGIGGVSGGAYSSYPSNVACCPGSQGYAEAHNDGVIEAGKLAAEKAIKSMKSGPTSATNACEGNMNGGEKSSGTAEVNLLEAGSSGSDFSTVLNAWYMAGLHTGRYLAEQSKKDEK